ncbi:class I SAM-dependent methyltransferase [Microcoleus sp. FACHB-1515]|uniref:class I SAM-dependent methyltransferase n=1 Tax=Cyanophyceae TaxID=3028117 RepID=UPI0016871190|nr:class I SAM-dependent methyltransferase [Microcoleus sp. FACHB-1515]MBD2089457.1 class I SAM-dependent methyltransferase [Microcoleus sp. FACHB-1515]
MESRQASQIDLDRIREQYDRSPYPRIPLENSPKNDYNQLFIHNMVTPYYLRYQRVVDTQDKLILDVGCGSGYKSLQLAEANPGAKIVGIDLSPLSIDLAKQRLAHHGFENVEFHAMSVDDIPQLGMTFDYINCDELLYILPNPIAGLHVMKSVLKPQGLLRTNLHSAYQRQGYHRGQALFQMLGLTENNPGEEEVGIVIETMKALKDDVALKAQNWQPQYEGPDGEQTILMNHLLLGDKGFTVAQMFAMLRETDLEFVSMVNWRQWEVTDLFKDADDLPAYIGLSLLGASPEERLRAYELMHPVHRLLDFWCTHPDNVEITPIDDWSDHDWQNAIIHLHPQLRTEPMRESLTKAIEDSTQFQINRLVSVSSLGQVFIENTNASCLLPLWESPQPFKVLVDRFLKVRPVHPVTLEPTTPEVAFQTIKKMLNQLEAFLFVLPERSI